MENNHKKTESGYKNNNGDLKLPQQMQNDHKDTEIN